MVVSAEIKNAIARRELIFNDKKHKPAAAIDIDTIVKAMLNIHEMKRA